jgi:Mrp family chromosome partitioning ATPase
MFVPLEPKPFERSADVDMQFRCDLACGALPRGMHTIDVVASVPRMESAGVPSEVAGPSPNASWVASPTNTIMTQVDAALQRGSAVNNQIETSSAVEPNVTIQRSDPPQTTTAGPHVFAKRPKTAPRDSAAKMATQATRWKLDAQGPVSHSVAPVDPSMAVADPTVRTPLDKFTTYRAYTSGISNAAPAALNWSQGLVESSRRRDWLWPKIVDELIGRQWSAINQLGRTALSSSREETRRVLITSTKVGEGRTTIALALARWAALTGQRTLLVDADMLHPGLTTALHIESAGDWRKTSLAFGVENSLITCRSLPLSLLPMSPSFDAPTTHATLEQLIVQLAVAEQEFDCCIIDAGSISELSEQIATVTRLSSSVVVVNGHAEGVSPVLIGACNVLWQRGKPAIAIADNFRRCSV